jgi:protein-tyrosine phosphatase
MSLLSRLFSKKSIGPPVDLAALKTDMHSHLIPGIDDGSSSMDETIAMLSKFQELGFKKIITTPHVMSDCYKNTPETILGGLEEVRAELQRIKLDIEIEAAAEYYFDETLFKKLENKDFLTFAQDHVLIEFSFSNHPSGHETLFFDMLIAGYKPVIAHFERYNFLHGSINQAREWREKGLYIQLNINSLFGTYGWAVKKQAELLIDSGQVDFLATDCHRIDHLLILENNLHAPYLKKALALPLRNDLL